MGRICPILNHPLNDGVLVEDEVLVNFIQKRNLDFLPNELVCRSCKHEVTKLYNKKLKKAFQLQRSLMRDNSVSSLKTSKTSSSERSLPLNEHDRIQVSKNSRNKTIDLPVQHLNGSKTHSIQKSNKSVNPTNVFNITKANVITVSDKCITLSTSLSNNYPTLQENNQEAIKKTAIPREYGEKSNVTIRKKTIKDYMNAILPTESSPINPKITNVSRNDVVYSSSVNEEVVPRLSQEPTTSKAANKRNLHAIIDSDDEDRLSLNAVNGTPLPHIQPIPPKRKPEATQDKTMARDIMDDYIKTLTGG